ncbi:microfibril-associated glycoprotein 4-like [Amphiura filiformis]|uniref:microfibril-associated glycoprotein 4-like n=1 Tax=Amphiura filiformis TaxID=82378 RepID=UPI003B2229FC
MASMCYTIMCMVILVSCLIYLLLGLLYFLLQNQLHVLKTVSQPANEQSFATDCQDLAARGHESGAYTLSLPDGLGSMKVFCDMETDKGGWTVFQRRFDGSVDFYRDWDHYDHGFGDANGEYWLGLRNIRRLISQESRWILRIDLEHYDSYITYAVYDSFMISDNASNYALSVGTYSGNASDNLKRVRHSSYTIHDGMQFTTYDRDNDHFAMGNCASIHKGAWWYNRCYASNLNGLYILHPSVYSWYNQPELQNGMIWNGLLKRSEMKIKRIR